VSHKVSYKWIRRTQYITSIVLNYKNVGCFTWRVSDCEELVGGYSQEMMGLVLGEPNLYHNLGDFTRMWDFTWREFIWL